MVVGGEGFKSLPSLSILGTRLIPAVDLDACESPLTWLDGPLRNFTHLLRGLESGSKKLGRRTAREAKVNRVTGYAHEFI